MVRREGRTRVGLEGGQDSRRKHSSQNSGPKPPTSSTLRPPAEKKSTFVGSTSAQPAANQPVNDKKKGATDKEVVVDLNDIDKKFHLST
jgi:hypothetical protein